MEVDVNQPVALSPVIKAVDAEHSDIHMRILHPRILPIRKLQGFRAIGKRGKKEVVWHGINVRKAPVLREALDRLPQAQDILLGFHVVPIDRGRTLPQRLIELNLPKDVESMGDCKAQGMEAPQFLHAPIQVSHAVRIAGSCAFQILCNLVPKSCTHSPD